MRIVVKVGTSTLAHPSGLINIRRVEELCKVMSDLKNAGHDIILVTSGAIGMGAGKLQLSERPRDVAAKQAAAAVGQCELMYTYDKLFSEYNHTVAQLLMTGSDFENEFQMALMNHKLNPGLDTMFLTAEHQFMYLSSSAVKELARYDADVSDFLPAAIIPDFKARMMEQI